MNLVDKQNIISEAMEYLNKNISDKDSFIEGVKFVLDKVDADGKNKNIQLDVQYGMRDSVIEDSKLEFRFRSTKSKVKDVLNVILKELND